MNAGATGESMKRSLVIGLLGALAIGLVSTALASAHDKHDHLKSGCDGPLTIAVYGDSPYALVNADYSLDPPLYGNDTAELDASPAFIKAINDDKKVKLVLFAGDIHGGKEPCTFTYDQAIAHLWSTFRDPLIYTPGDNEWADCHKSKEGGDQLNTDGDYVDYANGNPVANLGLIRQLFFPVPGEAIGGDKTVVSQAQAFDPDHPTDAEYVENVMWEQANILFVSVNIPGGANNDAGPWYGDPETGEQIQERLQRTAADIRWLEAAFAAAVDEHVGAVVILTQADMWDIDGNNPDGSTLTNYDSIITTIATNTADFGKPVLLFNGDSHDYRSDNPLVNSGGAGCLIEDGIGVQPCLSAGLDDADAWATHPALSDLNVPNFHRLTVHGSVFPLEYLRVSIDTKHQPAPGPNSFGPLSWERIQP
jgi:hypothetical protein